MVVVQWKFVCKFISSIVWLYRQAGRDTEEAAARPTAIQTITTLRLFSIAVTIPFRMMGTQLLGLWEEVPTRPIYKIPTIHTLLINSAVLE